MSHPPPLPPRALAALTNRALLPAPRAPELEISAPIIAPVSPGAEAALSSPTWSTPADSALVTLPPGFIEALRKVVPRRRRAKLPYVVSAGLLAVVGVLAADASTRELLAARWRHEAPNTPPAMAIALDAKPSAAKNSAAVVTAVATAEHPSFAAGSAPSASTAAAPPKPARPPKGPPKTTGKL